MSKIKKFRTFIKRNLDWAALLVLPFLVFSFQYDLANPFVSSKELALRSASMILVFILGFATLFKDKLKILKFSKRLKLFITIFAANLVLVFFLSVNKIPFLFGTFERGFGLIDIFLLIAIVVIFIVNYKSSKFALRN